jgi:RNA polymerase-binding transcription factor DksA
VPEPDSPDHAPRSAAPPDAAPLLREARAAVAHRIAALTGHVEDVVAASVGSNADDEHDPEGATIAFERSQLGALLREAHAQLAEVDAAEDRLALGTYGRCESCGGPIAPERLEARPTARTCIACASAGATRTGPVLRPGAR